MDGLDLAKDGALALAPPLPTVRSRLEAFGCHPLRGMFRVGSR